MLPVRQALLHDSGYRNILRKVPASTVLYYPCLPEGFEAGVIKDYSGQYNNGTIDGATWVRQSNGLLALNFDGNDYVDIDIAVNDLATTTTGTWMAWVRLVDATPATAGQIIAFGDTDVNESILLAVLTTGVLRAECIDSAVSQWQFDSNAAVFSDNTYAHVALIQDGTAPIFVVNGVEVAITFNVSTNKTRWFSVCTGIDNGRIGCINRNNGGNTSFLPNGRVALPTLITTNLTVASVKSIYKYQRPLIGV